MGSEYAGALNRHYGSSDLSERIAAALQQAGKHSGPIGIDDLAPLDQFHVRGKAATLELAELARLRLGLQVLDVGGGLGGPARTLASEYGCEVTVLDLTEAYCRAGEMLTLMTELEGLVRFHHGNALDIPFADACFDLVWMQHANMNIEDKAQVYREAHRLLRAGGRLAIHEIVAGSQAPVHFPVPWAPGPEISFLCTGTELQDVVESAGFRRLVFRDGTDAATSWFRERLAATDGPPPLGLHLLLRDRFRPAFQNLLKNLEEQRVRVIAAVFER